jgi:hypothetical protein
MTKPYTYTLIFIVWGVIATKFMALMTPQFRYTVVYVDDDEECIRTGGGCIEKSNESASTDAIYAAIRAAINISKLFIVMTHYTKHNFEIYTMYGMETKNKYLSISIFNLI